MKMPQYAGPLERTEEVARQRLVGQHGGVWIYDVGSNEELE